VPWIIRNGGQAYLECGKPNNGGTKIYSVSGDVELPGNYEVPMGTPFSKLLELAGGVRKGRTLKAVIPGGSSAPVLPASIMMECTMDYDSIAKAGSMLGSGAVIVMDDSRCMVESLKRLSYFYMHESCGQCTPCREGTGWLWRVVDRIHNGHGKQTDMDLLNSVADNIQGRTICALGDAAAMPVRAMIKHFRHEFEAMIKTPSLIRLPHPRLRLLRKPESRKEKNMVEIELDGQKVEVLEGSTVMHAAEKSWHLHSALLLSQEAEHCRQLPHVPGRRREGAQAHAGLRHTRHAGHDRAHQERQSHQGPKGRDGVPADQPSAGLPDLRPGRRVPAAGSGGRLRRQRIALRRRKARRLPQGRRPL
jgi:hypothetical protein